ncbi:MAG: hypothetical protein IJ539_07810 [Prevotella sp.]|nr:hypothetical protein [Prevotella sp.]MBQ8453664.1 hypothetical protein [Prevotella sp.]
MKKTYIVALFLCLAQWAAGQTDSLSHLPQAAVAGQDSTREDIFSEDYFKQYLRQTPGWKHHKTTKALAWTGAAAGPVVAYSGLFLAFVSAFGDSDIPNAVCGGMMIGGLAASAASVPLLRVANRQAVKGRRQALCLMPDEVRSQVAAFRSSRDYRRYRLWKGIGETSLTLGIVTGTVGSFIIYERESGHKHPLYTPALVPAGILVAGGALGLHLSKDYRQRAVGHALDLQLKAQPMTVVADGMTEVVPAVGLSVSF